MSSIPGHGKDGSRFKLRITSPEKEADFDCARYTLGSNGSPGKERTVKLKVSIDGETYAVEVEVVEEDHPRHSQDRRPVPTPPIQSTVLHALAEPGLSPVSDLNEAKLCRSPVAGIVVHVPIRPGQQLQVNDLIVVLEAMKMESAVTAEAAGRVKSVNVAAGDSVKLNQVLVEFD
jgi:methylmalonyl-CoA carboxyltransferase small subunit